jgi:hypothetical protein
LLTIALWVITSTWSDVITFRISQTSLSSSGIRVGDVRGKGS